MCMHWLQMAHPMAMGASAYILAAMIAAASPAASQSYHSDVPGATLGDWLKLSRSERSAFYKGYFETITLFSVGNNACAVTWFYQQGGREKVESDLSLILSNKRSENPDAFKQHLRLSISMFMNAETSDHCEKPLDDSYTCYPHGRNGVIVPQDPRCTK